MEKIDREELRKMIRNGEDVRNVDTSEITDMRNMFAGCKEFNQDISKWDVSNVKTMSDMFSECVKFNQDISKWDVSSVTNMDAIFSDCHEFNQDISKWDVSSVTNMRNMLARCFEFNQDISAWDVSNVEDMSFLVTGCVYFNQDISKWDVSNVKDMGGMFLGCEEFNQDISAWDVSNLKNTDMYGMFYQCNNFDFKFFKGKVIEDIIIKVSTTTAILVSEEELKSFDKDRLLSYLAMYKHNDAMKIKVLSTLSQEKILYKQGFLLTAVELRAIKDRYKCEGDLEKLKIASKAKSNRKKLNKKSSIVQRK